MLKSGISQIGGKFRLRKTLMNNTPYHEYFLSLFTGSGIYELNKKKAYHYECFNELNPEFVNYWIVIKKYFKEFEEKRKKGPYTIVSRYLYELLNAGVLTLEDMIEQAIQFFYKIKLSFASQLNFRGLVPETTSKRQYIEEAKRNFRGIIGKRSVQTEGNFKSNLGKTTRPISNNDCGILTELNPDLPQRLKYVIFECLDFRKVYQRFFRAYYKKKGLTKEVFIYADPPYPGTEQYYGDLFKPNYHYDLIDIMIDSPFNFMLSIGKECGFYLDALMDAGWIIKEVTTRYSTNANTQSLSKEYLCMNYNIDKFPKMVVDNQITLDNYMEA